MSGNGKRNETIYVVDDDPAVRDALTVVFEFEGFDVAAFESADRFLDAIRNADPACVLVDVHMPGRSGIDLLKILNAENYPAPVFIISGQADIPMAVSAIKLGAYDFIEKPFDAETVVDRVRSALQSTELRKTHTGAKGTIAADFAGKSLLTPRELEVLGQITGGASNKEAGRQLGISPRTIEVHRARIMEKLNARNAADLVRIVLTGEVEAG